MKLSLNVGYEFKQKKKARSELASSAGFTVLFQRTSGRMG